MAVQMGSAVVLDLGSSRIRAGIAHSFLSGEQPAVVVSPSVAGSVAEQTAILAVRQGHVTEWAALERILHDVLYTQIGWEMGEEGCLLVAEPLSSSRGEREMLAQIAFEVFNVSGLFFADQAVLSLFSIGKSTGVVIDYGHEKTDVAMVVDGQLYGPSVRRLPFGGADVTRHLAVLLAARGVSVDEPAALRALKEACAQADDGDEAAQVAPREFRLPDGRLVTIRDEGTQLAACMLQPSLMGIPGPSVAEVAAASVFTHLDPAVRKAALDSIMVCGGGSSVPGIGQKLCRELRQLVPPSMPPFACTAPEYMPATTFRDATWMGGALLSKVLLQHNHYITKGEYQEFGPAVSHRKVGL